MNAVRHLVAAVAAAPLLVLGQAALAQAAAPADKAAAAKKAAVTTPAAPKAAVAAKPVVPAALRDSAAPRIKSYGGGCDHASGKDSDA